MGGQMGPQQGKGGMPPSQMGGNPQNVSLPGLYAQQQGVVNSGMFDEAPQSQISPDFLRQLSMFGLSGLPGTEGTGGSNVQGQGQGSGVFANPNAGLDPGEGGYSNGGVDFRSMNQFNRPIDNDWRPDWLRELPLGNINDFNRAQNYPNVGKQIGTGAGAVIGGPLGGFGGLIGEGIGTGMRNNYVNNHINMSPYNNRGGFGGLGPITFGDYARVNSSWRTSTDDLLWRPSWVQSG